MRRWPRAAAAAALVAAAVLIAPVAAGAEAPIRSVVAKASAQGVRAVYTIPDYVVVSQIFDGGGPVTQAETDSTGRATSFASLPYPGENAIAAPGVLSVGLGRSVPVTYPFYVQADHPTTPESTLSDPTGSYALKANAADGSAAATGALQGGGQGSPPVAGSRSLSSALLDDGGAVRTVAESVITGLSLGSGALRIASVTTRSETVLRPEDPKPVTTTSLLIEGASVAGHAVTIDGSGVHAEGRAVPAPLGQGAGTDNEFLGQLGLSASVVPTGVPGGADALVITSRQIYPAPGNPKGTLVMTVGGAASEITVGSPDGPALDTPAAGAAPAARPGPPAPAVAAATSAIPPVPDGPGTAPPIPETELLSASTFTSAPAAASAAGATPEETRTATLAVGASPVTRGRRLVIQPDLATTGALYSLLGLGAVAMVGATRLLRWKAVRR